MESHTDCYAEFHQKMEELGDEHWEDPEFPHDDQSLMKDENADEDPNFRDGISWKCVTHIPSVCSEDNHIELFEGGIEASDIKQGALGNCYFLSSLAALTEVPQRIKNLFVNQTINSNGVTGVLLCKNGLKQCVLVDDCIPVNKHGEPAFTRTNGHETWVIMIEKAWAKIHGSYERIVGGDPCNTIRDLCGAPGNSYEIAKTENLWDKILAADEKDHII